MRQEQGVLIQGVGGISLRHSNLVDKAVTV